MVFSSIPVYLDPPSNWNQQQSLQLPAAGGGGVGDAAPLVPGLGAVQRSAEAGGVARTISMSERARLAKIPQPEQPLKCPRCHSANTKFCYFNNYSLSQPRHFCKACRRYWTRGGALRNVPVGGGCRRNKRSKSSAGNSSKSAAAAAADRQAGTSSSSSTATGGDGGGIPQPDMPQHGHLPFLTSMQALADYGPSNLGLNFTGLPAIDAVTAEYQVGSTSSIQGLQEQWRLPQQIHQFPFMGGLEAHATSATAKAMSGMYNFNGEGRGDGGGISRALPKISGTSLITQLASVKMEDNAAAAAAAAAAHSGLNLPRQYLHLPGNDQYWSSGEGGGSGGWAASDLSVFNSSSSGNIL